MIEPAVAQRDDQAGLPRVLIVGSGHAGASVAAMAVAAGLPATIWSRRPLIQLSPDLQALCRLEHDQGGARLAHLQVQWWNHDQDALERALTEVDWLVLADEPRGFECSTGQLRRCGELATQRYHTLLSAGFDQPGRSVVRIGSPAGERPDPGFVDAVRLPYVELKQRLLERATSAVDDGIRLSTVAPGEIHSGFSTYEDDPYRMALAGVERLPVLHDIPVAAVSDRSVGEAVLVAAAGAPPGGWYEVSDGTLGPGRALQLMIRHLDVPSGASLVEWSPKGAAHLFGALNGGQPLDLDVVAAETRGLEDELDSLRSLRRSQTTLAERGLWWAGSEAQERARQATATMWAEALGLLTRSASQQVSVSALGLMLALGPNRDSEPLDELAAQVRLDQPQLAERILPSTPPTEVERAQRLAAAVKRQAVRSSM